MVKNNRADGRQSEYHNRVPGKTCSACGGSGSAVDSQGRHVDACSWCRGWGKV